MKWQLTSHAGDTFDMLAKIYYGSEYLAYLLIMENPHLQKYAILPSGLTITFPETPKSKLSTSKPKPPWVK
jgi:phage tail protein X